MKRDYSIGVEASKIYKQKLLVKITNITFSLLLLIFSLIFFLVYIVNSNGNFVVKLDQAAYNNKNIFLSEDGSYENMKIELKAKALDSMDNISINWIKKDVNKEATGSHNGDNYMAYTFYVVNGGTQTVNYWYQIDILDVIKRADEAIRVMVFRNDEKLIYAKKNSKTNAPEPNTLEFHSDSIALLNQVKDFKPEQKDKYTIVIWLEGDDPECVDDIIGGAVKLQMNISEEHIDEDE